MKELIRRQVTLLFIPVVVGVVSLQVVQGSDLYVLIDVLTMAVFAVSMNFLLGLAGQASFGHAMFYGTGGYAAAVLTTHGMSLLVAFGGAIVFALGISLLVGFGALRVKGHWLAMLTFAAGQAWYLIVRAWDTTGGVNGLPIGFGKGTIAGLDLTDPTVLAPVTLVVLVLFTSLFDILQHARFGRLLLGVKEDETLVSSAGVDVRLLKLAAFALSGVLGAVAGFLGTLASSYIDPNSVTYHQSIDVVVVVALGGLGFALGPWYGAAVLVLLDNALTSVPELRYVIFGTLTLIVLLAFPRGIAGLVELVVSKLPGVRQRDAARIPVGVAVEPNDVIRGPEGSIEGPALSVRNLTKAYGGVLALSDVSFDVAPHDLVAIVGPNGAGKSSLFNAISNWTPADSGEVFLGGRRVNSIRPQRLAKLGLSRTFQTPRAVLDLTVEENVTLGQPATRTNDVGSRAGHLLKMVDLQERSATPVRLLSHGERKRVELVRVLLERPVVALLDEPFAGLNQAETDLCLDLMRAYVEAGGAIVFVEHDLDSVVATATRVVVLEFGRVIADDTPTAVLNSPAVIEAYLAGGSAPPTISEAHT